FWITGLLLSSVWRKCWKLTALSVYRSILRSSVLWTTASLLRTMKNRMSKRKRRHLMIPDVQAKPGHDFSFLTAVGNYAAAKKPDAIIQIGDFADMCSLSSYDRGKKAFEGRRYKKDIEASHEAMMKLMTPIAREWSEDWHPAMHL